MIAYLSGIVLEKEEKALILVVGGIGYRVLVASELAKALEIGEKLELCICHHITDTSQNLFGFRDKEEQRYFELLLLVPSVGPKTAMTILDAVPSSVLAQAVLQKDISLLTKVSGVGKKTAERIMVELAGKMGVIQGKKTQVLSGSLQQEAVDALVSIGFKPAQAKATVAKLPSTVETVEEAVREALRQ